MKPITLDAVRAAPKVVLHDHLDGALRPATILELADEIGWTPRLPTTDLDALQAWFTAGAESKDLLLYLATFEHTIAVMQRADHIERVAYEAAIDLVDDGVVYAEMRFAPEQHQLPFDEMIDAVASGIRRAERDAAASGRRFEANMIICAMRTEQRSLEVVHFVDVAREREAKVVAFDLCGAETGWPPSLHADALRVARERHINLTIHASEWPDLDLISDAIAQGAHRIGHGVRLDSDTAVDPDGHLVLGSLAQFVLDRQIHLEMAPTCNTQIGAVASVADHPLVPFLRAGFNVSVNTDNRLMSAVRPSTEMHAVAAAGRLSWSEIGRLVEHGITSSFAPWDTRQRLLVDVVRPAYAALTPVR